MNILSGRASGSPGVSRARSALKRTAAAHAAGGGAAKRLPEVQRAAGRAHPSGAESARAARVSAIVEVWRRACACR